MPRGILTAYLFLVTAAGPCLCCCAGQFIPELPASTCQPATTPGGAVPSCGCGSAAPAGNASGGCCSTGRRSHPTQRQTPAVPCPACPCGGPALCCGAPVAKLDESGTSALLHWLLDAAPALAWFGGADRPALPALASADGGRSALPFLTPSDLLHVHHRLRC